MIEEKSIKKRFINFIKNPKEVFLFFLPILILLVFLIPVPYYVQMGGGVIKLDNKINIDTSYENGYYGALYVRETKGNILTYLLSVIVPSFDNEKIENVLEYEDEKSYDYREKLLFTSSLDNATKIAFEKAGKEVNIKESNLYVIYIDKSAKVELHTGDQIIKVSGSSVNSYDEMLKKINESKDKVYITVIRDNKEIITSNSFIDIDGDKKLGIVVSNEIKYSSDPKVSFSFKGNEAGSSGGLMIALSIYDKLTDNDLTKGKKVLGTGSIDMDGNVLEIGGIKHKLMACKNADIVFIPYDNKEEAEEIKKEKNYKFDLVPVKTFDEAVNYLKNN